jgi:hypothetical protein
MSKRGPNIRCRATVETIKPPDRASFSPGRKPFPAPGLDPRVLPCNLRAR